MLMPAPDQNTIAQKARLAAALAEMLPKESVIVDPVALKAYESDGLTAYRQAPLLVTLPRTTAGVSAVLWFFAANKVKAVPRGAGTSLSGGALPLADGVVLGLGKLNKILEIDIENRCAVVQPGVQNLAISNAVRSEERHVGK